MGAWISGSVRLILGFGAIGLALLLTAFMATEAPRFLVHEGAAWEIWLGQAQVAAIYLIAPALFVLALWPRLWPAAMLPLIVAGLGQALLAPERMAELAKGLLG